MADHPAILKMRCDMVGFAKRYKKAGLRTGLMKNVFDKERVVWIVQRPLGCADIFQTDLEYRYYTKIIKQYKRLYRVKVFAYSFEHDRIQLVLGSEDLRQISSMVEHASQNFTDFLRAVDHRGEGFCLVRSRVVSLEHIQDLLSAINQVEEGARSLRLDDMPEHNSARARCFGMVGNGHLLDELILDVAVEAVGEDEERE